MSSIPSKVSDVALDRQLDLRGPLRFLIRLARCQPWRVLAGLVFASLWMISLALPTYTLSRAIDDLLGGASIARLAAWAAAVLGAGVLSAALAISRHRTMSQLRINASFQLNWAIVRHAVRLGSSLSRKIHSGHLAVIGLSDVGAASTSLTVTGPGIGAVVTYLVVGILLSQVSGLLALVVLLGVPVIGLVVGPIMSRVINSQDSYRSQESKLTSQLVDAVAGLRVLNAFGGRGRYQQRFTKTSEQLLRRGYRVASVTSWVNGVAVGLPAIFLAVVTWLAARLAVSGEISPGELIAVYGYTAALIAPVTALIEAGDMIGRGIVAAQRIIGFLKTTEDTSLSGERENWQPADSQVLRDLETGVFLPPGAFVGLVCDSTEFAARTVDRLGAVVPGAVAWGEETMPAPATKQLRRKVLVAQADATIFAGTIGSVVRGARTEATDAEVQAALEVAAASDVVTALGGGLDGVVNSEAMNLSGGQRQRLLLARAVLQGSDVLLVNEPTSALDAHTETIVAERLRVNRQELQTLIATTSPLVLSRADVIFLVIKGQLVAYGTHIELSVDDRYRALVLRGEQQDWRETHVDD